MRQGPCRAAGIALALALGGGAQADTLRLPSGVAAQPLPPVWDEDMSVIRLRYVVERLSEPSSLYAAGSERVFDDMQWLCETQARRLFDADTDPRDEGWTGAVVTLMDREVEFGITDMDAIQLFEWFTFTMDGCEIALGDIHD